MSRFAHALVAGLVLATAGCAGAGKRADPPVTIAPAVSLLPSAHAPTGPFVAGGEFAAGPGSGLWGDTTSGRDGDHLGCIPGRLYAQAVSLRNDSTETVTLTGATGRHDPAPRIIGRVATQLSLAPPKSRDSRITGIILRHWSAAPARPVAIPPGRSAVVQSNFRMPRCNDLADGRTLVVPGELLLSYRVGDAVGRERVPEVPIILTRGPTKQPCTRVAGGSSSILASNIRCRVARRASVACHPMAHGSWGTCMSNGKLWDCGRTGERPGWAVTETCWLPHDKSHWFRVSWKHGA